MTDAQVDAVQAGRGGLRREALNIAPLADLVSRADVAAEAIRLAILRGELRAGQPLVERELAALLGVSKTPVREALKLLSRSGLVTISAYRGATVQTVDAAFARSIYEVRLLLEPPAARLAASRQDEGSLNMAESILSEARAAGEAEDYATLGIANRRFHRILYERCGNPVLVVLLDDLQDKIALISTIGWSHRPSWLAEAREHQNIVDLIRSRKPAAVEKVLRAHIAQFLSYFLERELSENPSLQ